MFDVSSVLNIVFFVLNIVWCIFCIKYCFVVSWWCIFCQETAVIVSPPRPVPPTHCHKKCHISQYQYQSVLPSKSTTKYQKYHLPKISSTTNTLSSKMSYKPIIHYHALFTKLNDVLNISCSECDWNDSFMHKTFVSYQPIYKFVTHLLHIFVWLKWFSRTFMHKTFVSSRDKLQTESNWLAWSRFKSKLFNKNAVFSRLIFSIQISSVSLTCPIPFQA